MKQTDGKKYAMNLVDVIRPVIDPKFKSLLREKIGDETFKALKETYSTNVTPGTQAQFDNEFKELIGTNGGNDKITAQVMHEFAMQANLRRYLVSRMAAPGYRTHLLTIHRQCHRQC